MKNDLAKLLATVLACSVLIGCDKTSPTPVDTLYVVGEDGNFRSITAALDAAPSGTTIEIRRGTYAERVVINQPGMKLRAQGAVLDGAGRGMDGRGIGILVSGVSDVEISGLTVQNFERGIVLRNATNATLRGNEVHSNNSKAANTAPPLAPGVDLFEGVVLLASSNNQIIDNVLRNNGHDGLMVAEGSRSNVIRGNRILNNGAQTVPGRFG